MGGLLAAGENSDLANSVALWSNPNTPTARNFSYGNHVRVVLVG